MTVYTKDAQYGKTSVAHFVLGAKLSNRYQRANYQSGVIDIHRRPQLFRYLQYSFDIDVSLGLD